MLVRKFVALDPGRTTGYVVANLKDDWLEMHISQGEWSHLDLWSFLEIESPDHVVCESFEFRQRAHEGADLYPRELIGVVELAQQMFLPLNCVHYQNASIQSKKKAYFSDTKLKELGLYVIGVEHGRSATKHLLHWLQFGQGAMFSIKKMRVV